MTASWILMATAWLLLAAAWLLLAAAWLLLAAAWWHAERDRTAQAALIRALAARLDTVTTQRDALSLSHTAALDPDAEICPDWAATLLADIRSLPEDPR